MLYFKSWVDKSILIGLDIDGTLVDTLKKQAVATANFLNGHGMDKEIGPDWVKENIYHMSVPQRIDYLQKAFEFEVRDKEEAFRSYVDYLVNASTYGKVIKGVPEILEEF
ncbi:MAG: hypothetical protein GXO64_01685, partial [Candidatus Micrarchaeota archaeon]|nr:hypothetical protein [Candidatus Micrarchaeota archaeon]